MNRNESPDVRVALESPEQPEVLALVAELDAYSNELTPPESRHQADVSLLGRPDPLSVSLEKAIPGRPGPQTP